MAHLTKLLIMCGVQLNTAYRLCRLTSSINDYTDFLRRFGRFFHLGSGVNISLDTRVEAPESVAVGDHVSLAGCVLRSGDGFLDYFSPAHPDNLIAIGNHTFIGKGAEIYPGVTIGCHAHIMPGAVVATDVDSYTTVYAQPNQECEPTQPKTNPITIGVGSVA